MEWNNAFKSLKEMESKAMMDMALIPNLDPIDIALGSSEKGNASQVIKPRKKSMTSIYLKYFETAPDGKSRRCKFCKQSYSIATATGNLGRHLSHRHPGYDQQGDAGQQITQAVTVTNKKPQTQAKSVSMDFDNLNWLLLNWLITASLPPTTLEENSLLNSFKFLNPSVKLWSKERVQAVTIEVSRVTYMSMKGHWIDENWSLHNVLLDVTHIPYPCTDVEIHHAMMKTLRMYNIEKRILSCTHNNYTNAIQACRKLKEEMDVHKAPFYYLPCAAHTLNLIIEDCLRTPKPVISKIREFVLELNASPEINEEFRQLAAVYPEGSWKFPLDASTRWNGHYTMLDIVRKASLAMDKVIANHEDIFASRNFLLQHSEKSAIVMLCQYLEPFHKVTNNLCSCKAPTIGLVLFFMDHVIETIGACRDNRSYPDWLKSASNEMAKAAQTFCAQVYKHFTYTAAVLDPRIKAELIPEELNLETNLEDARTHFLRNYSTGQFPSSVTNGYGSVSSQDGKLVNGVSYAEEIARKRRRTSMSVTSDELTQYLSEPPAPIATDVLDWWKVNSTRYPRLSVMARDYLAVQPNSVSPDELFSSRGDDAVKQRMCLGYGSAQAVLCVQSWSQSGYRFKFRTSEIDFEKLLEAASLPVDGVGVGFERKLK
ncbi:hypothetical protein QJS10_CPB14g00179 [Acorus calamus]|uniref:Uncharacterized protein n=1 Tax=Acorus calamus TaxID=4465 RepID=A0AAV9DAK3_ACOCL|nr:hypothetical protein QJS10_CPB14g00179 [Acorus calamus]